MKTMKKFVAMFVLGTTLFSLSGCGMIAGEVVDTVLEKNHGRQNDDSGTGEY